MEDKQQLKEFNNKYIDIELLFLFVNKLKRYDNKLYKILKDKLIIEIINESEIIPIKNLNLDMEQLNKFYDWHLYFNRFEDIKFEF